MRVIRVAVLVTALAFEDVCNTAAAACNSAAARLGGERAVDSDARVFVHAHVSVRVLGAAFWRAEFGEGVVALANATNDGQFVLANAVCVHSQ